MTDEIVQTLPADAGADASGFTPAHHAQFAEWAIADGHLTPAQIAGSVAPDAPAPISVAPDRPMPVDRADAEIAARCAEIGYIPAAPHEYQLPPLTEPHEPLTDMHYEFDSQARGWLSAAKLDASTGSAFADFASQTVAKWRGLSEIDRAVFVSEQRAMLHRLGYTDERLTRANEFVKKIDGGKLAQYLGRGAGADGRIAAMWIDHVERLHGKG